MKKNIFNSIAVFAIVLLSNNAFSDCDPCLDALSKCAFHQSATVTSTFTGITTFECGTPAPIVVTGTRTSAQGCVTSYNSCITTNNCACYPMAVFQLTSSIKRVSTFRSKRRG